MSNKSIKTYSKRIEESVIKSADYSEESVREVILNESYLSNETIVDMLSDAEDKFKEWYADTDEGAEDFIKGFGGVHSNRVEQFILNITDPIEDYTHQFKVTLNEYYCDAGSGDYMYSVCLEIV